LRQWCDQHQRTPHLPEQGAIVAAQLTQEDAVWQQASSDGITHVFCDTNVLLTAVYSAHYFSDTSLLPAARQLQARYDLTLLLAPDLPWLADGLQRDGLVAQAGVHARLVAELTGQRNVVLVGGDGLARLRQATRAVIHHIRLPSASSGLAVPPAATMRTWV